MELDKQEVLRYLGAGGSGQALDRWISQAWGEIVSVARPKYTSRLVTVETQGTAVVLGGARVESQSLAQHLRGCREAFLFACTLGPGVDMLIKRHAVSDMALAPVLQACSAAYIEAYADKAQKGLEEGYARKHGLYLRPRYSPGYGDFPLTSQRFMSAALDMPKKLGVSLTGDCMMVPFKSITAVIGLTQDATQCHIHRCMACTASNCPFRKETHYA